VSKKHETTASEHLLEDQGLWGGDRKAQRSSSFSSLWWRDMRSYICLQSEVTQCPIFLLSMLANIRAPDKSIWKAVLRGIFYLAVALLVAYVARLIGFNPFHLGDSDW
jgi:hypothetical protein